MAYSLLKQSLEPRLAEIRSAGLYKNERHLIGPQGAEIRVVQTGLPSQVLNLCANNYLGLANHPAIVHAAKVGLDAYGYGMASVRFICGTQDLHRRLEQALSAFFGTETRSSMVPAMTPTVGCSRPCLTSRMPSSVMR